VLGSDTKDALSHEIPAAAHCRSALLRSLAWYAQRGARFTTRRNVVARLFLSLLRKTQRPAAVSSSLRRAARYAIALPPWLLDEPPVPVANCDRMMELRAAFLVCGTLAAGAGGYHLEFAPRDSHVAQRLRALLETTGIAPKSGTRRGRSLLYFKEFDSIVNLLAKIGAHAAVLALEDIRALKETKNRIRRLVNTEASNLERSASAAASQRETIEIVASRHGLRRLSRPLREIATLRLRFPGESMAELGRRCDPPIPKPTVSGRFAALSRLARRLLSGTGQGRSKAAG
jgi:DNA-binding transcriptional regulator WhiA